MGWGLIRSLLAVTQLAGTPSFPSQLLVTGCQGQGIAPLHPPLRRHVDEALTLQLQSSIAKGSQRERRTSRLDNTKFWYGKDDSSSGPASSGARTTAGLRFKAHRKTLLLAHINIDALPVRTSFHLSEDSMGRPTGRACICRASFRAAESKKQRGFRVRDIRISCSRRMMDGMRSSASSRHR